MDFFLQRKGQMDRVAIVAGIALIDLIKDVEGSVPDIKRQSLWLARAEAVLALCEAVKSQSTVALPSNEYLERFSAIAQTLKGAHLPGRQAKLRGPVVSPQDVLEYNAVSNRKCIAFRKGVKRAPIEAGPSVFSKLRYEQKAERQRLYTAQLSCNDHEETADGVSSASSTWARLRMNCQDRFAEAFSHTDTKLALCIAMERVHEAVGSMKRAVQKLVAAKKLREWIEFKSFQRGVVRVVFRKALRVDVVLDATKRWCLFAFDLQMRIPALSHEHALGAEQNQLAISLAQEKSAAAMVERAFAKGFDEGCKAALNLVACVWMDAAVEQLRVLSSENVTTETSWPYINVTMRALDGRFATTTLMVEHGTVVHTTTLGTDQGTRRVSDALDEQQRSDGDVLVVDAIGLLWRDRMRLRDGVSGETSGDIAQ
jgi:hypothetical protein